MASNQVIFGLRAALVLQDKQGEFEVRNAFQCGNGTICVNPERVAEAIAERGARGDERRPSY